MPQVSRLEVISSGARRRWTEDEKRRIVAESFDGLRRVSATARRYGLSPSQLFTWRRQIGAASPAAEIAATFLPAFIECKPVGIDNGSSEESKPAPTAAGRMEIRLANGGRVIVGPDFDAVVLARLLDVLERRA
jgi:transposase